MKYILLLLTIVSISFASIGKITAINGEAYAVRGFSKLPLKEGSEIEKKDMIKTMPNTKLQIVFNDHTVISLGQKTEFKIDDYIFSKTKVKASFSVSKGIFKSITGKIGKIDHSKFKLRTKNATIGVRGTTFIGVVEDDKETIACTSGEIVVQNDKGMVAVKKGEVTTFRVHEAPKPAKVLDKKFIQKVKSVKPEVNSDNIVIEKTQTTVSNIVEKPAKKIVEKIETSKDITKDVTQKVIEKVEKLPSKIEKFTGKIKNDTPKKSIEKTYEKFISKPNQEQKVEKEQKQNIPEKIFSQKPQVEQNIKEDDKNLFANIGKDIAKSKKDMTETINKHIPIAHIDMDENYGDFADDMSKTDEHKQEAISDVKDNIAYQDELNTLKDKVGGATSLHYVGKVSGDHIIDDANRVSLDVDLGHGTIDGNIKFTQQYGHIFKHNVDWDTKVQGDFQGGNRFSLEAVSDGYSSKNGYTELQGGHLQHAKGAIDLTKDNGCFPDSHANISFNAEKSEIGAN